MNIAILIPELGGGGAERVAQIVGDYYVEHGNKVMYFLQNTSIKQDYPVKGKVIKTKIQSCLAENGLTDMQRMLRLIGSSLQMRRLKRKYEIDVAISFMEEFNYINILSKGREKVIVRVCNTLSVFEELYPENFLYKRRVLRFFYPKADAVIVLGHKALEEMKNRYRVPSRKIVRIPNMSVREIMPKQESRCWDYGQKAVVCVGRLHFQKQYERIIRAFSYTYTSEPEAKLIILGQGEQLKYLKRLCEKLEIKENVLFVGFTDNVTYYLKNARVFVMASKVEGFPNSMVEAMGCGSPIITTDSPGACGEIVGKPENIDRVDKMLLCKYGILTPNMPNEKVRVDMPLTEEEKILGEAIRKVLVEDETYEKYKRQSLKRAQMYSLDKVIKKWNHLVYGK